MDIQYLYIFVIALALSLLFISLLIRHSARLGLMDDPTGDSRKIHSEKIPRSGGLGIIMASGLAMLIILPFKESPLRFLIASLVIIGFGLLDDILKLSPLQKLGGQAMGVAIAMSGGMVMFSLPLLEHGPAFLSYGITFFFVMGVINGVNFSDGMDGLAAGKTLMALLLLLILALESDNYLIALIALAIAAALLGFLRFNTHPARIFMGDAGSQFLGFVVAWLAISISQSETSPVTTLMPLLILGLPVMDILQVIAVRIHKKLPLPGPDKEHIHHQIAKLGFRSDEVVALIYMLQAILLGMAYVLRFANDLVIFAFYVAYATVVLGVIYLTNISGWRLHTRRSDNRSSRRNPFFRRLSWSHPYTGKTFGLFIALYLVTAAVLSKNLPGDLVYFALGWAAVLLTIKLFSRNQWPLALGRLAAYTAVVLLTYGITASVTGQAENWLIDGTCALFLLILAVVIRITRKRYFWLTTQDLLVLLFIALAAPLIPMNFEEEFSIGSLIFRTGSLLYMCEYVLARGKNAQRNLVFTAIIALFFTALHL
jgi:UDP-GlcNAc:undecaprenyl-phosphate/decaprenyl-phosphate GlcNAc-1-phosphate transferase